MLKTKLKKKGKSTTTPNIMIFFFIHVFQYLKEKTRVGQSIATITGPSPGINVKSFVEIWFMRSIDYVGSVTYYNQ